MTRKKDVAPIFLPCPFYAAFRHHLSVSVFLPRTGKPKARNGENGNANSIEDIVLHIRSGYPDLAETAVHIDDFACDGT